MLLTETIQDQQNMPQIILIKGKAQLASYTFLQEMLINIKHVTFTALSTTKNTFFTEHLSLATFVL